MTYATCTNCRKTFNESAGDMGVWNDGKFICLMCDEEADAEFNAWIENKKTSVFRGNDPMLLEGLSAAEQHETMRTVDESSGELWRFAIYALIGFVLLVWAFYAVPVLMELLR